jgi:hypothetical protein
MRGTAIAVDSILKGRQGYVLAVGRVNTRGAARARGLRR